MEFLDTEAKCQDDSEQKEEEEEESEDQEESQDSEEHESDVEQESEKLANPKPPVVRNLFPDGKNL